MGTPTGPGMITTVLRDITVVGDTSSSTPTTLTSRSTPGSAPTTRMRRNKLHHRFKYSKVADKSFWLKHHLKIVLLFEGEQRQCWEFRRYQRRFMTANFDNHTTQPFILNP